MFDNQRKQYSGSPNTTSMTEYGVVRLRGVVAEMPQELQLNTRGTRIEFKLRAGLGTTWDTTFVISCFGDRKTFMAGIQEGDEVDCTCWLNSKPSTFKEGNFWLSLSLREISQTRPAAQVSAEKADALSDGEECAPEPGAAPEKESLWGDDDSQLPF